MKKIKLKRATAGSKDLNEANLELKSLKNATNEYQTAEQTIVNSS